MGTPPGSVDRLAGMWVPLEAPGRGLLDEADRVIHVVPGYGEQAQPQGPPIGAGGCPAPIEGAPPKALHGRCVKNGPAQTGLKSSASAKKSQLQPPTHPERTFLVWPGEI